VGTHGLSRAGSGRLLLARYLSGIDPLSPSGGEGRVRGLQHQGEGEHPEIAKSV
jgi:hypothetical protein